MMNLRRQEKYLLNQWAGNCAPFISILATAFRAFCERDRQTYWENSEMLLTGSCHCGTVNFSVESHTPYPYMHCHCSICRKTQGGGGYAINIMAEAATLKHNKNKWLKIYRAKLAGKRQPSPARRHFCGRRGSALWVSDPRWPQWIYPFASAIDTPLPRPPQIQHIMLDYAAPWIDVPRGKGHQRFREYPRLSIADWHRKHRLVQ